ncbi:class I SAM-dependent methyltransferase [Erythrobacter sp.]|jgi:2-polyprenyl-6-hydroxyphenyl methylase/3-demethylubiquinone-9 3-methyltransferase|uniref:class I SAM-dependent methyltransferase n=1 Tax=Erythrobacter sp. TaxID=1042 RepID=UPI002ECA372B|nr:class I SAM-dependent methyltransferase [Erythrobacter sp.]
MSRDLTAVEEHFDFGENWNDYSRLIDDTRIASAKDGLLKLVSAARIERSTFLDIGSGSGLHSCAAGLLGAKYVTAVDVDPASVRTTRDVLSRFLPPQTWEVHERSVFDMSPQKSGTFDIVYSWGVLHHTGDQERAIRTAASLVERGGTLVLALYRPTYLDGFWKAEKRWYKSASRPAQKRAQQVFDAGFRLACLATGRTKQSDRRRGMDYWHDVHDWLGGYPYESMSPRGLERIIAPEGFMLEREFSRRKALGLFGSGCDEFVYRRAG